MNKEISTQGREFLIYIRTQMFFRSRLKGIDKDLKVYVSPKEIESFFPFPRYDKSREIDSLISAGELNITEETSTTTGNRVLKYEVLKPGEMDIRYFKATTTTDPLLNTMKRYLKAVSLKPGSPSTPYFNAFLNYKDRFIDVFFSQDKFCGRIHTPVSNFHSEYRENILIHGSETVSFDVATMQPLLLGKILREQIGQNEFSEWIENGHDIYIQLQKKAGLETREQGKKRFFEILFSQPNDHLSVMFGKATWITWINEFKTKPLPENPHNRQKPHSNLAWLLQKTEVKVMRRVWGFLATSNIPFLSVHDEIIVQTEHSQTAETIFRRILQKEFKYFKLNCTRPKEEPEEPTRPQTIGEIFDLIRERGYKSVPPNWAINAEFWESQN